MTGWGSEIHPGSVARAAKYPLGHSGWFAVGVCFSGKMMFKSTCSSRNRNGSIDIAPSEYLQRLSKNLYGASWRPIGGTSLV